MSSSKQIQLPGAVAAVVALCALFLFQPSSTADVPGSGTLQNHACTGTTKCHGLNSYPCEEVSFQCAPGSIAESKKGVIWDISVCQPQLNSTCGWTMQNCFKDQYYSDDNCTNLLCTINKQEKQCNVI